MVILAAGIAVGNVLLPSLIKRDFPHRVGSVTTAYAVALTLSASMASGVSVPLANLLPGGWRSALSCWGRTSGPRRPDLASTNKNGQRATKA